MVGKDHDGRRASHASHVEDMRLRRGVVKIRQLGDRPLYELFIELGAITGHRATIDAVVARFAGIDPLHLRVARGDRFAPEPPFLVEREP
jgi:hypothetical protein